VLWDAIELSVFTAPGGVEETPPSECGPGVESAGRSALLTDSALGVDAGDSQRLAAEAGAVQHYCFVLTLPAASQEGTSEALMGRTIAPAWEFAAESVAD